MKIIGLLGGMSWESTLGYYRTINEGIKNTLGGLHSAKIAMYSVDFDKAFDPLITAMSSQTLVQVRKA